MRCNAATNASTSATVLYIASDGHTVVPGQNGAGSAGRSDAGVHRDFRALQSTADFFSGELLRLKDNTFALSAALP
jgi:hypothetical protein